jgi:hypothetical protein
MSGTLANTTVLFGHVTIASETSLPTLFTSMSIAAEISTSLTWYPPRFTCMSPGIRSVALALR